MPLKNLFFQTSTSNGNHITSRIGTDLVDAVNLLALMLPGATLIHQGDELGVADTILEWATSTNCWPNQASPSLTPFPWDESISAGFTTGDPWLPLPPNYRYANAKMEFSNEFSHAGVLKVAAALRKSPAMGPHSEVSYVTIKTRDNLIVLSKLSETNIGVNNS